ncbi:MAG: hypothetical protein V4663_16310 [Bacteroidota bacterium]
MLTKDKYIVPTGRISCDMHVINDFVFIDPDISHGVEIDAIFIPTQGKRDNIHSLINDLHKYTSKIFVITSEGTPEQKYNVTNIIKLSKNDQNDFLNNVSSSKNPSRGFKDDYDLPAKRNLALKIAKENGFENIALIDDDMIIGETDIFKAGKILQLGASAVGFYSLNFPDKSVVDLIECILYNNSPDVFLSGNCLFINMAKMSGFFPYVYNEDWMFIISNINRGSVFGAGIIQQCAHEPYSDFERIRFEQFGDVIASGAIKAGIDKGVGLPVDLFFWEETYRDYQKRLLSLLREAERANQFVSQLSEALKTVNQFKSEDIVKFIKQLIHENNERSDPKIFDN